MNSPLVSVIIPVYNSEKYIRDTIESVLKQTYKNFEIIVVDDGSTDITKIIIDELKKKDSRIQYIFQSNQGQSAARNKGIEYAKGKYIAFLDADDLFLPDKVEQQVAYLEAHPDCDISYSKIYHFFDTDPNNLYYFDLPHPSGNLFSELLRTNFINPLSVMLKKELLDKYGGFENEFRRMDEQYLWIKLSLNGARFCYIERALGLYRMHKKSLTHEKGHLKLTQEKYLEVLALLRSQLSAEEIERYHIPFLEKKAKQKLRIGKLMAGNNFFAKFLFALYNWRRQRRLTKVL